MDGSIKYEDMTFEAAQEEMKPCPNCSARTVYNADMKKLFCEYCHGSWELDITPHEVAKENDYYEAANRENEDWTSKKITIECKSCGAVTEYAANVQATTCPFCNSVQVTENELTKKTIAPSHLIPFMFGEETARGKFSQWLKSKWLAPKALKKMAKLDKMKGVYYPYWTYDADTFSKYIADSGKDYTVTVQKTRIENGKTVVYNTTETRTKWVRVSGHYDFFADDVLINSTHEDVAKICHKVEPFDHSALIPYDPQFLAGFAAQRYTVGLVDGFELAKSKIARMIEAGIDNEVRRVYHADHVRNIHATTEYSNIKFKHILLPLWISSYMYKGKMYRYIVNGQTGKTSGEAPLSPFKVALLVLGIVAVIAGVCWWFYSTR
ncbi:MAG: hypothetical protein IKU25_01695 [Clostridia bacterium]|nr:hypothetical protein [Clostridia bacterium]